MELDLSAQISDDDAPTTPPRSDPPRRPRTRGDCVDGHRPCPWVSCEEHLMHARLMRRDDGRDTGNAAGHEMTVDDCLTWLETTPHTCALDAADRGGITLEEVGDIFGVTRERVRQIEAKAQRALLPRAGRGSLATYLEADLDARDPDSDNGRPTSRGKHTTARPVEDTRRVLIAAPATWTGPTHPDQVAGVAETFWCGVLGAAMPVALCCARQVAEVEGANRMLARQHPRYRGCAECPEGNALRARLGVVPDAMPTRPNLRRLPLPLVASSDVVEQLPARAAAPSRAAWLGDDEATEMEIEPATPTPEHAAEPCDAPQHDELPAAIVAADPPPTHTEETSMHSDSDSQSDEVKMTVKADGVSDGVSVEIASGDDDEPVAQCAVQGCARSVAGVRSDTTKSLRGCCRECRHRGAAALRDSKATAKNVIAWLGETYWRTSAGASMARPPTTAARAHVQKPADLVAAAPTACAAGRRSNPPLSAVAATLAPIDGASLLSELRDARRALDIARRVGGVDALEQIVAELVALRG